MKNPLEVWCPKCHAAVGIQCMERNHPFGWISVNPHSERVEKANGTALTTERGATSGS